MLGERRKGGNRVVLLGIYKIGGGGGGGRKTKSGALRGNLVEILSVTLSERGKKEKEKKYDNANRARKKGGERSAQERARESQIPE